MGHLTLILPHAYQSLVELARGTHAAGAVADAFLGLDVFPRFAGFVSRFGLVFNGFLLALLHISDSS